MQNQENDLLAALQTLDLVEQTQGRNAKSDLLKQQVDNLYIQDIMRYALGSYRYFVTPPDDVVSHPSLSLEKSWVEFRTLLKRLRTREVTGNAALAEVSALLSQCPASALKWYTRILNHDLRIGIGHDVAKALWGDEFLLGKEAKTEDWKFTGCALAKPWADVWSKGAPYPLGVERKLDGERALVFIWPATGKMVVTTRNAKRREAIEGVEAFGQQLIDLAHAMNPDDPDMPMFFDGEFLAKTWNDTSSLIRKTKNFDAEAFIRDIRMLIFDWAPTADYCAGRFDMPWLERKIRLLSAVGCTRATPEPVEFSANLTVLGHVIAHNDEELQAEYNACLDAGFEGIVAKVMTAPELFKRTANNVKLKPTDTQTVTITGAVAGQGKHAAASSAFISAVSGVLNRYGKAQGTVPYMRWTVDDVDAAMAAVRKVVADDTERRLEAEGNVITLRTGARLGYFTAVTPNGDEIHVGGGYTHKTGRDQRMDFWLRRDELLGKKIDIKVQQDKEQVGVGRFNRFSRIRDDL